MTNNPTNADGVKCYSLGEVMDHVADPTTEHPTKWALWADFLKLREEVKQLRNAIKQAGFAVMETSGDWSIHDISELGKREQEKTMEVISQNVDLTVENERLKKERDQAHDAAVEGCAKVCDRESHTDLSGNSSWLARQIRKLKRGGNG